MTALDAGGWLVIRVGQSPANASPQNSRYASSGVDDVASLVVNRASRG